MYSSDIFQLNILLYSVGFGFLSALFYDVFKTVQFCFFNSNKGLFFKDLLYVLSLSYSVFVFVLTVNNGKIRIYLIVGIILGFICWFMSLSSHFTEFIKTLIISFKSIFLFLSNAITFPLRMFYSITTEKILKKLVNSQIFFRKAKNKFKIHLKKR